MLSTRKLKQVEVQVTRHSPRAALTPQVGRISSLPRFFCALEAQEQFSARISTFSCCWQPFLLRSRQQRFFSLREEKKVKKENFHLPTACVGEGPMCGEFFSLNLRQNPSKALAGRLPVRTYGRGVQARNGTCDRVDLAVARDKD